uniref:Uncharacterized protein n=1 Tax=Kalanchoe fedtschenkoi TaxID=63787 RepID=A0A7N0VD24_KALFE
MWAGCFPSQKVQGNGMMGVCDCGAKLSFRIIQFRHLYGLVYSYIFSVVALNSCVFC